MASFTRETTVLRFSLPHVKWAAGPRWVLWPALAWRVVAPRPRQRELNLFQKATLGLCRAGVCRATDIGERLMVDPELAALILSELVGNGWLDERGRPTSKGTSLLEEEEEQAPPDEQTVGWTFTDPFSGETWPRFHEGELPHAEVERNEEGYPVLRSGSIGNPIREHAFTVLPHMKEAIRETQPRVEDILRATRSHRRQFDWDDSLSAADAPYLQQVSFISHRAQAYLLAARVWRDGAGDWRVDDPFGFGDSVRLRRWLEDRLDLQQGLRKWLAPVVAGDDESEDLKSLGQRAAWEVEERLTIAIRRWGATYERLVSMQRALLETGLDGCPEDKWDDVALKAQRVAERLFQDLLGAQPPRTRLTRDPVFNEELANSLAKGAGFRTPLPQSLARVRRGKVHRAHETGSGSLRPLVLLALLGTAGRPEHPLARAAQQAPDLLHRLDALAAVRDEAAHERSESRRSRSAMESWRNRVREAVETTFTAVRLLLTS